MITKQPMNILRTLAVVTMVAAMCHSTTVYATGTPIPNGDFARGLESWQVTGDAVWSTDSFSAIAYVPDDRVISHYVTSWQRGLWSELSILRWSKKNAGQQLASLPRSRLISASFVIAKPYVRFFVSGRPTDPGNSVGIDLDGDGSVDVAMPAMRATGGWQSVTLDVSSHIGQTARFVIIDESQKMSGGWDPPLYVAVAHVRQSDVPAPRLAKWTGSVAANEGKVFLDLQGTVKQDTPYRLSYRIEDMFTRVVAAGNIQGAIQGGKRQRIEVPFKAGDRDYYRATLTLLDADDRPQVIETVHIATIAHDSRRMQRNLDQGWTYCLGEHGQTSPPAGADWQPVTKSIIKVDLPRGGATAAWFAQTLEPGLAMPNQSVLLTLMKPFRQIAYVFVNGHGFEPFPDTGQATYTLDLTPYLRTDGPNTIHVRLDNRFPYLAEGDRTRFPGVKFQGGSHGSGGFIRFSGAKLTVTGPVRAADVYPMTFVSRKQIEIEATVHNSSDRPRTVTITHAVHDPRQPLGQSEVALPLIPMRMTLAPGESRTVTMDAPWTNPRQWSYENPNIYRLRTRVRLDDGAVSDETDTLFGFREYGIAQGRLTLNGVPVRMRCNFRDTGAGRQRSLRAPYGVGEPRRIRAHKRMGFNMTRNANLYDTHDQDGLLVYNDYPLAFKRGAITDPQFWSRYNRLVADIARAIRHHPSIPFHSVTNEMIHSGEALIYPDLPKRFRDLAKAVHAVDRTRLVLFNGDLEAEGYADTINYHYAKDLDDALAWPNEVMWVKPNVRIPAYNQSVAWHGYKPLLATEAYNNGTLHSVTHLIGERAFLPGDGYNALLDFQLMNIRAIQAGGVSGHQRWRRGIKIPWIDILPLDETRHAYAGRRVTRRVILVNDLLGDVPGALTWALRHQTTGRVVDQGMRPMTLPAGISHQAVLNLEMPTVSSPTDYQLEITFAGRYDWALVRPTATLQRMLTVYPTAMPQSDASIVLIDPDGVCAKWSDAQKNVRVVGSIDQLDNVKVVVIAPGASPGLESARASLATFMKRGGWVLCLEQEQGFPWSPIPMRLTGRANTQAFIIGTGNDLIDAIRESDLAFWRPNNWVIKRGLIPPQTGAARMLIGSGSRNGLDQGGLIEVQWGRGGAVFCQLLVGSRLNKEPLAARLLTQWVDALSKRTATSNRLGVLASAEMTGVLDSFGVSAVNLADADRTPTLDNLDVVLIEAAATVAPVASVRKFVEQGGTLWLSGLTPETLEPWSALLPAGTTVEVAGRYRAYRTEAGPAGLSMGDMYGKTTGFMIARHNVVMPAVDSVTVLVKPNIMVEYRLGKGRVIVDQLRWREIEGSGGPQAKRMLAALLAWLHVPAQPPAASERMSFTPVELIGNRSLDRGTSGGGWLGHGDLDMADLPRGRSRFLGVPFVIDKDAAMASAGGTYGLPNQITFAEPDAFADEFTFLITSANGFIDFDARRFVGQINIRYEDNLVEPIPILYGPTVGDWTYRAPEQLTVSQVAWTGRTIGGATPKVYLLRHRNPYPKRKITAIELVGMDNKIIPIVIGVTLGQQRLAAGSGLLAKKQRTDGAFSVVTKQHQMVANKDNGSSWWVIAPWDNPVGRDGGFSIAFGPEQSLDTNAVYTGLNGAPIQWQLVWADPKNNRVLIDAMFPTLDDVVGYGLTYVWSPTQRQAVMVFGSDDDAKVWLNGKQIHEYFGARSYAPVDRVNLQLQQGYNALLVKCVDRLWGWRFQLWFEDQQAKRMDDIHLDALKREKETP